MAICCEFGSWILFGFASLLCVNLGVLVDDSSLALVHHTIYVYCGLRTTVLRAEILTLSQGFIFCAHLHPPCCIQPSSSDILESSAVSGHV